MDNYFVNSLPIKIEIADIFETINNYVKGQFSCNVR